MKNLPIDVLRTFVTVAHMGSFTQAGDLLGRTQPAISLQIKRLEDLTGKTMFYRNGPKVELNDTGETFLHYAEQILQLNDLAISNIDSTSISGEVRLGIPSEFATALLPRIVGRFIRTHTNVTLDVQCQLSRDLVSKTARKKYDLVLALNAEKSAMKMHPVKTDEMVWVAGQNYDENANNPVPLIVAPHGCIYRKRAIERLDTAGIKSQIVFTIPDLSGIQAALEENLGITVLARSTVPDSLKIIPSVSSLPKLGELGISLVQFNHTDAAVTKLAEYLAASLV